MHLNKAVHVAQLKTPRHLDMEKGRLGPNFQLYTSHTERAWERLGEREGERRIERKRE